MITDRSQRWRERRDRYLPSSSVIDPSEYAVDVISCERQAKPFVETHHYSASFPASRLSVGLFRNGSGGRSELAGVCTFSVPVNSRSVPLRTGLGDMMDSADLGRLVLLDDVAGNGETWFLSRALKTLRREKPGVLSVISYADPVERHAPDGTVVKPGHIGQIYAVMGAAYRGRAKPRLETITPDGRCFNERKISKIRKREQGVEYSVDELVSLGAPRPTSDDLASWLASLYADGLLRKQRHPGNHVYVFELTKAAKIAGRALPREPYPILSRDAGSADVTALPLLLAA